MSRSQKKRVAPETSPLARDGESLEGRASGFDLASRLLERFEDEGVEKLLALSDRCETEYLEFKSSLHVKSNDKGTDRDLHWNIAKSLYALANTSGGVLFIGIKDNGEVNKDLESIGDSWDEFCRKKLLPWLLPSEHRWTESNGTQWESAQSDVPDVRPRFLHYEDFPVIALLVKPADQLLQVVRTLKGGTTRYLFQREEGCGKVVSHDIREEFDLQSYARKREVVRTAYYEHLRKYFSEEDLRGDHGGSGAYRIHPLEGGVPNGEVEHLLGRMDGKTLRHEFRNGEWIGGYQVVDRIGEGGMGLVYHVRQDTPRRDLALKCYKPQNSDKDEALKRRFVTEAKTLEMVRHAAIPMLHGLAFDEAAGCLYFVMDLIEGESDSDRCDLSAYTLSDRASGKLTRVDEATAVNWLRQLCDVLSHLHAQGFVHRDIKLENILVDGKRNIHLTDFGIVKIMDEEIRRQVACDSTMVYTTSYSRHKPALGTMAYLSPEIRNQNAEPSPASDVWALGVAFFRLLTDQYFETHQLVDRELYESCSYEFWSPLLLGMLKRSPEQRWDLPRIAEYIKGWREASAPTPRPVAKKAQPVAKKAQPVAKKAPKAAEKAPKAAEKVRSARVPAEVPARAPRVRLSLVLALDTSGKTKGECWKRLQKAVTALSAQARKSKFSGEVELAVIAFGSRPRLVMPPTRLAEVADITLPQPGGRRALLSALDEAKKVLSARPFRKKALVLLTSGLDATNRLWCPDLDGVACLAYGLNACAMTADDYDALRSQLPSGTDLRALENYGFGTLLNWLCRAGSIGPQGVLARGPDQMKQAEGYCSIPGNFPPEKNFLQKIAEKVGGVFDFLT